VAPAHDAAGSMTVMAKKLIAQGLWKALGVDNLPGPVGRDVGRLDATTSGIV
jgi:hypothetical protein